MLCRRLVVFSGHEVDGARIRVTPGRAVAEALEDYECVLVDLAERGVRRLIPGHD